MISQCKRYTLIGAAILKSAIPTYGLRYREQCIIDNVYNALFYKALARLYRHVATKCRLIKTTRHESFDSVHTPHSGEFTYHDLRAQGMIAGINHSLKV